MTSHIQPAMFDCQRVNMIIPTESKRIGSVTRFYRLLTNIYIILYKYITGGHIIISGIIVLYTYYYYHYYYYKKWDILNWWTHRDLGMVTRDHLSGMLQERTATSIELFLAVRRGG